MKIVIFAGGSGRRLWPISRQKSPKQFEPIIGEKSTLQLAVERVLPQYGADNIFISTNRRYVEMVREQLPALPPQNIIGEPTRRDLAAAVGLAIAHLSKAAAGDALDGSLEEEKIAILWGDNYMDQVDAFRGVLGAAETLLQEKQANILFIGETPRFANSQLGWLELGENMGAMENGRPYYRFNSLTYRPPQAECDKMFADETHVWNTGYFVTTLGFVRRLYQQQQPAMAAQLNTIESTIGSEEYDEALYSIYPDFEAMSFDDAILQFVDPSDALVLHDHMGWSDPGTLYALKEAIDSDPEANVTKGQVIVEESRDTLVYNYEEKKLVVAAGLDGIIVVNTEDAIVVVHKDNIGTVKGIVDGLEGTALESYS